MKIKKASLFGRLFFKLFFTAYKEEDHSADCKNRKNAGTDHKPKTFAAGVDYFTGFFKKNGGARKGGYGKHKGHHKSAKRGKNFFHFQNLLSVYSLK